MAGRINDTIDAIYTPLGRVDETYREIPDNARLEIRRVAQAIPDNGLHELLKRGFGMDLHDIRPFDPHADERREISARHTARAMGELMVAKRQAEIRHHIYAWRNGSAAMNTTSLKSGMTKKTAAEIQMLALLKRLVKNEEAIGIVGGRKIYKEARAIEHIGSQFSSVVNIVAGADEPDFSGALAACSTVLLYDDLWQELERFERVLDSAVAKRLDGYLVMTVDPVEMDFLFDFPSIEFRGLAGEGSVVFNDVAARREGYLAEVKKHIDGVRKLCNERDFNLVIQRTDDPLVNSSLHILDVPIPSPEAEPVRRLE